MSFPNVVNLSEEQVFTTQTTEKPKVGTLGQVEDGRLYRFVEAGATALLVGRMTQSEVPLADTWEEAVATMAAGETVITGVGSTTGSPAIDSLKEGYLWFPTAADLNPAYRIKSNTLITAAAATGTITLYSPLEAAVAAATTVSYIKSPFRDVIIAAATTPTAQVIGVATKAIALDAFGWLQSRGPARVLTQGTLVISDPCGPGSDAGSTAPIAATELTVPVYGTVLVVQPTTLMSLVYLQID